MSLPEVYILGAPKAGTTSLSQWLACHPDIYFSALKEPVYWAHDYPQLRRFRGFDTKAAYEGLFSSPMARAAQLRAEGSTVYLYSREAVPRIMKDVPQARFIVALRNPADLVVSFHRTQRLLLNEEEADFAAAWQRCIEGRRPSRPPLDPKLIDYAMVGCLGQAVVRLLETVPREQVHIVNFDDMARDPGSAWESLTKFLGVSIEPKPDFAVHNPSSRMFRYSRLQRLRERPPPALGGLVRALTHWSVHSQNIVLRELKHRIWWREEPKPDVSAETRAELAEFFADDVRLLGRALRQDFTSWTLAYPKQ